MNWRWVVLDFLPRELPLTREERKRATRRMHQLRHSAPRVSRLMLLAGPFAMASLPFPLGCWMAPLLRPFGLSVTSSRWVAVSLIFLILSLAYAYFLEGLCVESMRRALREMGYDVCLRCGYWLRGLREDTKRCPECGTTREPPLPGDRS